jgi:hypothetical protein
VAIPCKEEMTMKAFATKGADSCAQDARVTRALRPDADFTFLPDHPGAWICSSPSGATYRVSSSRCSCPDFAHRCEPAGLSCKHMVALGHKLIEEGTGLITEGLALAKHEALLERVMG